jgi:hypothetical protein
MPDSVRDEISKITGKEIQIADDVRFLGRVQFQNLIEQSPSDIPEGDTTPIVLNRTRLVCTNTGATSITQFKQGQEGQEIKILGDGFTTLVHGTYIKTNTAANKLLAVNKVYTFTRFNSLWIENG